MTEKIKYIYLGTKQNNAEGRMLAMYHLTHTKDNRVNDYMVFAELGGFTELTPRFVGGYAEFLGNPEKDSNDMTLTSDGVWELFYHVCTMARLENE